MHRNDDFTPDPLDPLAPRSDDPRIGRWGRRLAGSRGAAGTPLAFVATTAIAVVSAAVAVVLFTRCGDLF